MQGELREELSNMLNSKKAMEAGKDPFEVVPVITPEYMVRYRQLMAEIYVGGVYIRLFLKQPTFRLSNPVLFCEKVVEFWESSFYIQVPDKGAAGGGGNRGDSASDSRAIVLGNEDFLGLLTSCLICAVKGEPTLVDHLLSWGFVHSLVDLLKRALKAGRRGSPMVCCVRILHQMITTNQSDVVDNLASAKTDIVQQLTNCLNDSEANFAVDDSFVPILPPDAALIVELLKKLFQSFYSRFLSQFVQMAMNANLPNFLLDHVLGAPPAAMAKVLNPSALKIHTVDLLKAIIAASNEETAHILQTVMNAHHAWSEYKDQSHDLFITDKEKTDIYLIQDSIEKKFAGLLTDGSETNAGISSFFTSTGAPPTHASSSSSSSTIFKASSPSHPPQAAAAAATAPAAKSSSNSTSSAPTVAAAAAVSPPKPVAAPVPAPAPVAAPRPDNMPTPPSSGAAAAATTSPASFQQKQIVTTTVEKGDLGIGLDLAKTADGGVCIVRFKEFPAGSPPNPATLCNPPILPGDVIVGVNTASCRQFADVVKNIRGLSNGKVSLVLERG